VEALVLDGAIGPAFEARGGARGLKAAPLKGSVFEEIDLVSGPSKSPCLRLSAIPPASGLASSGPILLARSRVLIAAIELPWCAALASGSATSADSLQAASVTTLLELKAAEGPGEIVGWQLVRPSGDAGTVAGLALRARDRPTGRGAGSSKAQEAVASLVGATTLQAVDVQTVLEASSKAHAGRPAASSKQKLGDGREDYLRHLQAAVVLPKPLFGAVGADSAEPPTVVAVAKAVADVQKGQLAHLAAKQAVLKHLTTQLPVRASNLRTELKDLRKEGERLQSKAEEAKRAAERVQTKEAEIEEQHASIVKALSAELQLRELDNVAAGELPRLWAQLHELRQAFELLRAAAAPGSPEAGRHSPQRLNVLEKLQRTWTDSEATRLRERAEIVEALVAAATKVATASGRSLGAVPAG